MSGLFGTFLVVVSFGVPCFGKEASFFDEKEPQEYFVKFVDPEVHSDRTVSVDLQFPVIGTVRLTSEPGKQEGTRHVFGDFPTRESGGFDLAIFHWESGKFDLLPDGAISYLGSGKVLNTPVIVGLKRLRFLTEAEKKQLDTTYEVQVNEYKQQQRFIKYLEEKEKKLFAEKKIALEAREDDFKDSYGEVQYRDKWLKLQGRSLDQLWKDFLVHDADILERQGQKLKKSSSDTFLSTVKDNFTIGEVVFSITSENGFLSLTVGDTHVFNIQEAEIVFGYKQTPFIRGKITLFDQLVDVRVGLDIVKKTFFVALGVENFKIVSFVPALRGLFEDQAVDFLRFSGIIELKSSGALFCEGRLFDSRTNEEWNMSVIPHVPIILQSVRLAVSPSAISTFQAYGKVFGSEAEIFASVGSVQGPVLRATLQPAKIRSYLPGLPENVFSDLLLAGRLEISKKEGFLLRGKLRSENKQAFSLWGVDMREAFVDFNLAQLKGTIAGKFKVFDLDARALFTLSLGGIKKELSFAAELVNSGLNEWKPPALADYLKGDSSIETFSFKEIRLVCGIEQGRSPVKNLKKAFSSSVRKPSGKEENVPVVVPLGEKKKIHFFCAVSGEAVIVGQLCRAIIKVEKAKKFGFLVLAEPVYEFSLVKAFPEMFAYNPQENGFFQYFKNVFGSTALSNISLVLSTITDLEAGVEPGLNFSGAAAYVGDPYENPIFKHFFAEVNTAKFPIYLKKDGERGLGFDVSGVVDLINWKNSQFVLKGGTGDFGLFLSALGMEEIGVKDIGVEAVLYPLQAEGAVKISCLYLSQKSLRPMKFAAEIAADIVGIGGAISGAGDFDFGVYAAILAGQKVRDVLQQRIILRDLAFEFRTTWVALAAAAGGLASAPTVIGALVGAGVAIVTSVGSVGLSGGFEIGQLDDPLQGFFALKGGIDISELVLEAWGEKPGGFTSLVLFLLDVFAYMVTLGKKDQLFNMYDVQSVVKNIVPLDLEKFYLKLVPIGTRIGEVTIPFGLGGSIYLRLFGALMGFDVLLDAKGAYATAFVDPINFAGIYKLRPSKTISTQAKKIEDSFKLRNLKSASEKKKDEQIVFEVVAHLDEGLRVKTDFDVEFAQAARGSMRVNLGLSGLDLQGDIELKIPEFLHGLGIQPGGVRLWVKGTQINLDNPLLLLKQLSPENIALEIGFEDSAIAAIEQSVIEKLKSVEKTFSEIIDSVIATFIAKPDQQALFFAEEKMNRFCADPFRFAVKCAKAKIEYEGLRAKTFVLDRLDGVPDFARTVLEKMREALSTGREAFSDWTKLFRINRIFWRGTLNDVINGKIPNFTIQLTLLGNDIEWTNIAGLDLTNNSETQLNDITNGLARGVVEDTLKPIRSLLKKDQVTEVVKTLNR